MFGQPPFVTVHFLMAPNPFLCCCVVHRATVEMLRNCRPDWVLVLGWVVQVSTQAQFWWYIVGPSLT